MSKTTTVAVLILMAAVTGSCGGKQELSTAKLPLVSEVKIEKVQQATIDDLYEATGTVRSKTTSIVSSRILGSIIAVRVHEGERVRAGQTLIEIDSRDADAQLQSAQAGMREAGDALEEIERNISAAQSAKAGAEKPNEPIACCCHWLPERIR
jgi:multidrug efflux pump subunit AcrA (membrane-fusion protein)